MTQIDYAYSSSYKSMLSVVSHNIVTVERNESALRDVGVVSRTQIQSVLLYLSLIANNI